MSSLEHYFENLLFDGQDVNGDLNKNAVTPQEQAAVETCAQYVLYTIFHNREDFLEFMQGNYEERLLEFAHWVAGEVINDNRWEMNSLGFQEVACRKLTKLGIMEEKDGRYYYEHNRS